jgi:hypothetical protein
MMIMSRWGMARDGDHSSPRTRSWDSHELRWAAASGLWQFDQSSAKYLGPSPGDGLQPYGIALTNRNLTDGSVQVRVRFSEISSEGQTAGGLVLGFQSERARYLIVQLGGYGRAYSIAEFLPGTGWQGIDNAGTARNLEPNKEYEIDVRQTGEEVRMSVEGVPVLERILPQPLPGSQLGLFAWGRAAIDFSQLAATSARPRVFVAMQFGQPYDTLYQEVIRPRATDLGLNVVRIDEVTVPGIIFEDIKREITEAKIVIAEITAPNQNVFYELGYAHALNKPTILLAQRGKELPFDIRSYRVIFYDDSIGGKPALEQHLQKHLEAILGDS